MQQREGRFTEKQGGEKARDERQNDFLHALHRQTYRRRNRRPAPGNWKYARHYIEGVTRGSA